MPVLASDYIVYVDESGDSGLKSINPDYPVFTLTFCIFHKETYVSSIVPTVQRFKFTHWGHDNVVLRSYDIKHNKGAFSFLDKPNRKSEFMADVGTMIMQCDFTLIAASIDLNRHIAQYHSPADPYELALEFCVERLHRFLEGKQATGATTYIAIEGRGGNEDRQLRERFNAIVGTSQNYFGRPLPHLKLNFAPKSHNSTGLQFADLAANPIGAKTFRPDQQHPAFDVIQTKFRTSPSGKIDGWGWKVFP